MLYFKIKKIKYSNEIVCQQKHERLLEIITLISIAETENEEIDKIILSINFGKKLKNNIINKFILYSDNLEKLKRLKEEQKEIQRYLRIANSYKRNFFYYYIENMRMYHE